MSFFTPGDAAYVKVSVRNISELSEGVGGDYAFYGKSNKAERDAELARLEAFIDDRTSELERGKGSE